MKSRFRKLLRTILIHTAAVAVIAAIAAPAKAAGRIDSDTLVVAPHGTFNGVKYTRYEAMFEGKSSNGRAYRVPCQIIAPQRPGDG